MKSHAVLVEAKSFARLLHRAGTEITNAAPRIQERYGLTDAELRSVLVSTWGAAKVAKLTPNAPAQDDIRIKVSSDCTGSYPINRPIKVFDAFIENQHAGSLWFVWDHETQDRPVVHVGSVSVEPRFQRRGVSTMLHRAAAAWLACKGDFRLGSGDVVSEENAAFWEKLERAGLAKALPAGHLTMEWEMLPGALIPNSLLAQPPVSRHRLRDTAHFRRMMGRAPTVTDYAGVHTTGSEIIAAAYAVGSWEQVRKSDHDAYPVIIALDVSGLTPLPDVDAMLRGVEAVKELRWQYKPLMRDGWTLDDLIDDADYTEATSQVGDSPAAFIFDEVGDRLPQAIRDYADETGEDADELLHTFVEEGQLPEMLLTKLVDQQRYMTDFGIDRVVKIEAVKPWWHRVEMSFEDPEAQEPEERGYYVFTLDEWPFHDPGVTKVVYETPGWNDSRRKIEFHGTTSDTVHKAFPGLIPEETPFPTEDNDE